MSTLNRVVTPGLHHVTVFASDPQLNHDFHTQILGQRLVKQTVNFDDPSTYHTYFADGIGTPGSVLTFFPQPGIPRGTPGSGETAATTFAAPAGSLAFWKDRFASRKIHSSVVTRFGAPVLQFTDPDGMALEITELPKGTQTPFVSNPLSDIPATAGLLGFHSVTLGSRRADKTAGILIELLGYRLEATEGDRSRYASTDPGSPARFIDVIADTRPQARQAGGSVHHIAFRSSAVDHLQFYQLITQAGLRITPPQERCYFRSLYFREPGGTLFEIATDDPGFLIDESADKLGTSLKLPPWFEQHRQQIELGLLPLNVASPITAALGGNGK